MAGTLSKALRLGEGRHATSLTSSESAGPVPKMTARTHRLPNAILRKAEVKQA